jgi:hypothetical protein
VSVWRIKLPVSSMLADVMPAPEVFDIQTVLSPSIRTRLPVVSSSRNAFLLTREFLYIRSSLRKLRKCHLRKLL